MKIKTSAIVYGIRYIRRFGLRTLIISKIWQAKRTKLYDEGITSSFEDKYTVLRG